MPQENKTLLTVEDLTKAIEAIGMSYDDHFIGESRHALRCLAMHLRRVVTPIAPARPAPQFAEGDWVLFHDDDKWVGHVPGRIIGHGEGDIPYLVRWEDNGETGDYYDCDLLSIPPKPTHLQAGWRLKGTVEVPDGSKPYVYGRGCWVETSVWPADKDQFGGRRWIAELDPTTCPKCGATLDTRST